jgi:hypothetical protein
VGAGKGLLCLRLGHYTDQSPVVSLVVPNVSIDSGKDGPITTNAYTITGVKPGSELSDDDVASLDELPVSALHSPILRI